MTKALSYVEIDIPFCANIYGQSPCTATLTGPNPTGTIKCFNTLKTCQDRPAYIDAPVTLRFAENVGFLPDDIDAIASISNLSYTPATVSLGKDLGQRASVAVTFKDNPWPDTGPGFDKYRGERPYDPYKQGTFWGKFRARQPYLRGRPLRLIRGAVGQALAEMETRHYVIDSFAHNAANGTYTITAKDVLKFADDDRAQAPRLSNGFLNGAITANDLAAQLQPAGIGDEEYPVSGHVAIGGKEICAFTRDVTAGNDANAVLLLHMDGNDGAASFPDASSSGRTVTANGNAQVDTAQFNFGTGSALFDGTGDYLSIADNADWTFAGNFTVELRARWNALAATQVLFTHFTDANNRYFLSVSSAGALTFSIISASATIVTMSSAAAAVAADGTWRHIAVVRNGNAWTIYVDGASVASVSDSDAVPNFTGEFRIGADHAAANGFNGWIDEFRVSNVARWTGAFTPPAAPYQTSSNILALVRGQLGTAAINHDAGDRAQLVLRYVGEDVADIIRDLLVTYAGVPDSYIPLATWKTETANFLNRVFTADVAEPVGVNTLVAELVEDGALSVWWDDVARLLRLRVLRQIATDAARFDADSYLAGSFSSAEQPNSRVSQIWRYFAKRNPLEGQEDAENYRSVAAKVDLQAETDYGSSAIHKIFSRWIPFGGRTVADRANALYLSRFRDPPRRFKLATFRGGGLAVPQLGQGYRIAGLGLQDGTGAAVDAPIQITRLNPGEARFEIEAEEMLVAPIEEADLINRVIVIDANAFNIDLRALHDSLYPAPTDDDVGTAGVNLTCYVESGVIVASAEAASAAFVVGDWPVGFPITLVVNGRIQGAGGDGGRSHGVNNGEPGGTALYTRVDIDLEVGAGQVWGGGGGGGRGATKVTQNEVRNGSGGGGGAGQTPGSGGVQSFNPDGGEAEPGQPGTMTAGGNGGAAVNGGYAGGNGGVPGQPGTAGSQGGNHTGAPGAGGAAGNGIDGVSFVTVTVGPGDIRGPQIN